MSEDIFTQRDTNLSKENRFEIIGPDLCKNGKRVVVLTEVTRLRIYKRIDGKLFSTIRSRSGSVRLTSHAAQGPGKPILNKKTELVAFFRAMLPQLPVSAVLTVGSRAWWYSGFVLLGIPVAIAVGLVVAVLNGKVSPAEIPLKMFLMIPLFFVLGMTLVVKGKPRKVDRVGLGEALAGFERD